jgi:mono/diheme cytochrome c family protein
MSRQLAALAALAAAVSLASCAAIPPAAAAPPEIAPGGNGQTRLARGEALVRRHCGGCHAVGTTGSSRLAGAPEFRELHKRYEPQALEEALAEGILTGHPAMPEFRFPPEDVRAVIRYLDAIQARQRS